jgi:hypothetical protein
MSRIRILVVLLALGSIVLNPAPAHAGSVWDANDPGRKLDIRWVGVYQQADDRMRVTVSFYGRVRNRWFNRPGHLEGVEAWTANLRVGFTEDRARGAFFFALFLRSRHNGLVAWLCEAGSGCAGPARTHRVDRDTIRARILGPPYGPAPGWYFRAESYTHDLETRIDRTRQGVLT